MFSGRVWEKSEEIYGSAVYDVTVCRSCYMVSTSRSRPSVLTTITILLILITFLVIGFSIFVYTGFAAIKINGPAYSEIMEGKNLIADILPPPGYIIEPFQISLEMLDERSPAQINRSVRDLRTLEAAYIARHEYWSEHLPPGEIRKKMVHDSYIPAMQFFDDLNTEFIPAMERGDYEAAERVAYESLKVHYQQHRDVIDDIVVLAAEQNRINEETATQKETDMYLGMVVITIILLAILVCIGLIILHLLRPIRQTTTMIQEMSRGNIRRRLHFSRSDEIGQMADAMDDLADYLRDTFAGLSRIAEGDLSVRFRARDEKDEIAPALTHLTSSLSDTMTEIRSLISRAEEGRLQSRGDPERFEGVYREIIEGINNMLDAITIPLAEAIRVADEFSYAHFSARFDEQVRVQGDFIPLKEGMNTIGEEISVVRYKLSLLSSITRHDILNQITVVKSALDLIDEECESQESAARVISLIRSAVSNIREQISFTAVYEQMGVQKPVWHQISSVISKTRDSLNTGDVEILDRTGGIEIFADPMFGQVIYNLVENALRHGKSLDRITFSFEQAGPEGILIMADNGVGIAEEDKIRIFQKGFGKNTGLGLFLIQEILSFTNLTIRERGKRGSGARFEVHIPEHAWRVSLPEGDPEIQPESADTRESQG